MKISREELENKLSLHYKWLDGVPGGVQLNLTGYDLSNADMGYANLRNAVLKEANLRNADMRYAITTNINLRHAIMPDGTIHD